MSQEVLDGNPAEPMLEGMNVLESDIDSPAFEDGGFASAPTSILPVSVTRHVGR